MEKIWLSSYPEGVPEKYNSAAIYSLKDLIESCLVNIRTHCLFKHGCHPDIQAT